MRESKCMGHHNNRILVFKYSIKYHFELTWVPRRLIETYGAVSHHILPFKKNPIQRDPTNQSSKVSEHVCNVTRNTKIILRPFDLTHNEQYDTKNLRKFWVQVQQRNICWGFFEAPRESMSTKSEKLAKRFCKILGVLIIWNIQFGVQNLPGII